MVEAGSFDSKSIDGDLSVAKTLKRLYLLALSHGDTLFYQHRLDTIVQHVNEKRLREWAKHTGRPQNDDGQQKADTMWARLIKKMPQLVPWKGVLEGLGMTSIDDNRFAVRGEGITDPECCIHELLLNRSRLLTFSALNDFLQECGFYESSTTQVSPTYVRTLWIWIADRRACRAEPSAGPIRVPPQGLSIIDVQLLPNDVPGSSPSTATVRSCPKPNLINSSRRPSSQLGFLLEGHEGAVFEMQTRAELDPARRRNRRNGPIQLDMSPLRVRRRQEAHTRQKSKRGFGRVLPEICSSAVVPSRRIPTSVPAWIPSQVASPTGPQATSPRRKFDEDDQPLPIPAREVALFFKEALERGLQEASQLQQGGSSVGKCVLPDLREDQFPIDVDEERISELEFAQLLLMVVMRSSGILNSPEDAWAHVLANHFEDMHRAAVSPISLPSVLNLVGTNAPRGLRVCQTVLYDLLRTHMDWLLLPLFRAYLLVDKRQMDCQQWLQFMGDAALPNIDGNTANTIFVDSNQHDTEGMLTGTVAEALEFDEFLDALMVLASTEFGDESRYPTLISCHSQMWELVRWLRRVYGILEPGSTTPVFNTEAVYRRPPLVYVRIGARFSTKEGSPLPPQVVVPSPRAASHSKAQFPPFGLDTTSMSAVLSARPLYLEYLADSHDGSARRGKGVEVVSMDYYLSYLVDAAYATLVPVGPGGESDQDAVMRLRRLDASMQAIISIGTKKDRLWDALSLRGYGNGVNITSILDGLASSATDAKGPSLPPRLTMVYPPRLCIDEVSSFLIGGVFLPDLDELAAKAAPPPKPSRYTGTGYFDEIDRTSSTPSRVPSRPQSSGTRTQPRLLDRRDSLVDPSEDGLRRSQQEQPSGRSSIVPAQRMLIPTGVSEGARRVRELVDSSAVDEVHLERLENQGRPTTGGGLLPCPGYSLDIEIQRHRKLEQRQQYQGTSNSTGSSCTTSVAPTESISNSIANSKKSMTPTKVISVGGLFGTKPVAEVDESQHIGTSKSIVCPVSVLLGPREMVAIATQVDRNRWQVTFDIEDIDFTSLLPVVEVEERVVRDTVALRTSSYQPSLGGGGPRSSSSIGQSMREPGMMTPMLLEQSIRLNRESVSVSLPGGMPMFAPLTDFSKPTPMETPLHPLGVSMRDTSVRSPSKSEGHHPYHEPAPRCIAYSFKTRQSLAWRVKLAPKVPTSGLSCCESQQHVVLELTHTKDKLTVYQSHWLRGVFDQFCDPATKLLSTTSFMTKTLPRFRRFPVVLGVPSTLQAGGGGATAGDSSPRRGNTSRSRPQPFPPPPMGNGDQINRCNIERLFTLFVTQDVGSSTQIKLGADNQLEIHHVKKTHAAAAKSPMHQRDPINSPTTDTPLSSLSPTHRRDRVTTVGIVEEPGSPNATRPGGHSSNVHGGGPQSHGEGGVTFSGFLLFIVYAILGKKAQGGLDQSPTDFVSEVESMIPHSETESVVWLESVGIHSTVTKRRVMPSSSSAPKRRKSATTDAVTLTHSSSHFAGTNGWESESMPFFNRSNSVAEESYSNTVGRQRLVSRDSVGSVLLGKPSLLSEAGVDPVQTISSLRTHDGPAKVINSKAISQSPRRGVGPSSTRKARTPQVKVVEDNSLLEPVIVPQQLTQADFSMSAYHKALSARDRSRRESKVYGEALVSQAQDGDGRANNGVGMTPRPPPIGKVGRYHPLEPWQRDNTLSEGTTHDRWNALFKDHTAHVQQVSQSAGANVMKGFFGTSMFPRPPPTTQGAAII